jgi:hypothetical protein
MAELIQLEFEEGLEYLIKSTAAITDLINDRFEQDVLTQNSTLPAVVYQLIDGIADYTMSEALIQMNTRVQFTIVAESPKSRTQVYKVLKNLLKDYEGTMGGVEGVSVGVVVDSVMLQNRIDTYDDETQKFIRIVDFVFNHQEA